MPPSSRDRCSQDKHNIGNVYECMVFLRIDNCRFGPFCSTPTPVRPLPLLVGKHHRSKFHGERVFFFNIGMSAILKKRVRFWPRYSHFLEKGVYFLHIQLSPPKNSAFCRIRVPFEPSKVSVLENRGLFFNGKVSERGRFLFWRTIIRPPFRSEWRDRDPH